MANNYQSYRVNCVEEGFTSALRDKLVSPNIKARNLGEALRKGLDRANKEKGKKHYVESVSLLGTYYVFVMCPCCKLWVKTIATDVQC